MGDVVMVATMIAFVLVCVGYVGWCDRILTSDDSATGGRGAVDPTGDTAGDAAGPAASGELEAVSR